MKIGRFLGVVLSICLAIFFTEKYISESSLNGIIDDSFAYADSNEVIKDSQVNYNSHLNENNSSDANALTYTNKTNHTVIINSSDIVVNCMGSGVNAKDDAALVKKNMNVKASFAYSLNGSKMTSLSVEKGEKVYIFVTSSYSGLEYPTSEVNCSYSVGIQAM